MLIKGNWFEITSTYSNETGVDVAFLSQGGGSKRVTLTRNDVSYLLEFVDGHATAGNLCPAKIGFMLYGSHIIASSQEWADFKDALDSVLGQVWQPQFVVLDRPAFRRHPDAIIDGNDRGVYGQQQAVHG